MRSDRSSSISSSRQARLTSRVVGAAVASAIAVTGVVATDPSPAAAAITDPASYVNPLIGTQNDGNTFPGATTPFGMVQISPDTGHYVGYSYDNPEIRGFSQLHPSGVGCGLGGDLPLMPTTGAITETDYAEYASAYSHDTEVAEAGYYRVDLDDYDVTAELTATTRTGTQRYTFPATAEANVLVNAGQALHSIVSSDVRIVNENTIETTTVGRGFCQDTQPYTLYTVTTFDRPFDSSGTWVDDTVTEGSAASSADNRNGAFARFDTTGGDLDVEVTTAVSWVDLDGAYRNLEAEQLADFDTTREAARTTWNERLGQVQITGGTDEEQRTFYSSLYRTLISPNTGSDVDGRYTGWDQQTHTADFTYYQTWSLWDTYRTQQQLLSLLAPRESRDMARSILRVEDEGGWLPRWGYATVETNIMTGDPVTPWLVDAFHQGLLTGYEEDAYAALTENADGVPPAESQFNGRADNEHYLDQGFVRFDPGARGKPGDYDIQHGASATLEYALADAALGTMAAELGKTDDAARYFARGQNYHNIFDPRTGSFRARDGEGLFVGPAEPGDSVGFHEGTASQYMWLAQQDMPGLIELLGGREPTNERLDGFFAYDQLIADPEGTAREVWVNGPYEYYNAEQYNPQNVPNIHAPYTYLWTKQPWKSTDVVHAALTLFTDAPNGVTGNDDMGTMSAWHVLSAMGIYPVTPGAEVWGLTTPIFETVDIALDDEYYPGGDLAITAPGTSDENRYIQSVDLAGQPLSSTYVTGDDLRADPRIDFTLGTAASEWGTGDGDAPPAIDSTDVDRDYLSAGITPDRSVVVGGEDQSVTVTVPVVATAPGSVSGTLEVDVADPLVATSADTEWTVESGNLPQTEELTVTVQIPADTPIGDYAVTAVVSDERGNVLTREATVSVAEVGALSAYYVGVGIGDDGADNADFDGQGAYYSRQALAADGTVQGEPKAIEGTDLEFVLPLLPAGAPDNIAANGQVLDVEEALAGATSVALVGAGANGTQQGTMVLGLDDGTAQELPLTMTDWCSGQPAEGNVFAARTGYRGSNAQTQNVGCSLFATTPIAVPEGRSVVSITLPVNADLHIFAIARNASVAPVEPIVNTGLPVITGTARVGSTLTASAGAWSVPEPALAYQWSRDGEAIEAATDAAYLLTAADAGRAITVTVTASADGYTPAGATSEPVTVAKIAVRVTGAPNRILSFGGQITYRGTVTAEGVTPTGEVTILDGRREIATVTLDAQGRYSVPLRLSRGIHLLTAAYDGDDQLTGGLASPRIVFVL